MGEAMPGSQLRVNKGIYVLAELIIIESKYMRRIRGIIKNGFKNKRSRLKGD